MPAHLLIPFVIYVGVLANESFEPREYRRSNDSRGSSSLIVRFSPPRVQIIYLRSPKKKKKKKKKNKKKQKKKTTKTKKNKKKQKTTKKKKKKKQKKKKKKKKKNLGGVVGGGCGGWVLEFLGG